MKLSDMAEATGCGREELLYTAIKGYIADGLSFTAMSRLLGVCRTTLCARAKEIGLYTPKQIVTVDKDTTSGFVVRSAEWLRYKPGDVVREWRYYPGENMPMVRLRAVAAKQYAWFVLCDVMTLTYGEWKKAYRECFPITRLRNDSASEETI